MTLHSHAKKPKPGTWLVSCDVCGIIHLNTQIKKRWDNLYVCESDWERDHPQKLIKIPRERIAAPFERVESVDGTGNSFIPLCTIFSNQAVAGAAVAGCSVTGTWKLVDQGGSLLAPPSNVPPPTPTEDPYFSSVALLVHGNNFTTSTLTPDSSIYNRLVQVDLGATISSVVKKWGAGSLSYPINGSSVGVGTLNPPCELGGQDFTIECWVYPTNNLTLSCIIAQTAGISSNSEFSFQILKTNLNTWQAEVFQGNTAYGFSNVGSVTLNDWQHIALSRSGDFLKFFVNGTAIGTLNISGVVINYFSATTSFFTGVLPSGFYPLLGYIDDVRYTLGVGRYTSDFTPPTAQFLDTGPLYDPLFSSVSLLAHFNGTNGSTSFVDQKANTITANGAAQISTAQSVFGGASGSFNGTNSYLTIPNSTALQMGNGSFTIEFWVRYNSFANYMTIFNKGYTSAGGIVLQTLITTGGMAVYINGVTVVTESASLSTGVWYFYSIVRLGSTVTIYRDGSSAVSGTSSANINSTNQVQIGAGDSAGGVPINYFLNGNLDDLRITKGFARQANTFIPPTSQFLDN
jgi:hypothetical protein